MFDAAFHRFSEAFEQRANQVYGKDSAANGR
jgi:ribosome-associated toxin RatA of RatAB toxin-antitoxin module